MNGHGEQRETGRASSVATRMPQQQQQPPRLQVAPGLEAIHNACKELYPDQSNPLTVTAIVKYWLGGPDPLDYISMYENPGCPELGVPSHWHYVSLGLSDLHGDERLHPFGGPGQPSGFGFELTFRLVRGAGESSPPTWPAHLMQQLAKYVFSSGNLLVAGDHVSWHAPLDGGAAGGPGRLTQILVSSDAQLPSSLLTPHGDVQFVQIVGVTSDELRAAQHWNGLGLVELLKRSRACGPWLLTDMRRSRSIMDEDPSVALSVQEGIEREGSNLSGVSAKCCWLPAEAGPGGLGTAGASYRESRDDSDEEPEPGVKSERLSPSCERAAADEADLRVLRGLQLTFNLEAGSLLPLAIKGRVMHGRHFTFKSVLSHAAITFVAPTVTNTIVTKDRPYVVQGPWLQALVPDELAAKMAPELQVLGSPQRLQLPKTFSWPEHNLTITIVDD
ncbi:suppressor of fused homolog [Phymastichus coffea]|uniref:suppressor of fused homolog n=1 Tax=Phymastichus coffea TaxID=108790 RepID=UPI00273AD49B|nr:suppressor of fused homolog [Phymastichus coffea]XP_058795425.1 suppressor of fused homolog [Phymastichus coffea]